MLEFFPGDLIIFYIFNKPPNYSVLCRLWERGMCVRSSWKRDIPSTLTSSTLPLDTALVSYCVKMQRAEILAWDSITGSRKELSTAPEHHPHPALTSNSPIPSSLRKSHISQRPAGRLARRAITKVLLLSAKPVKYKESSAWGKGNGFQLQLQAGKGGEKISNPLFSIGFCSVKSNFTFTFYIS